MKRSRSQPSAGSARGAAFQILQRVELSGAFASVLLNQAESELADPRDAALLHEIVLGVLRRRALLDYLIADASARELDELHPEVMTALRIGAYGLFFLDRVPEFAAVDSAVELVKKGPRRAAAGFVNGVLRALARSGREVLPPPPAAGDVEGLSRYHSHPVWWVRRVVGRMGWEQAAALLESNNRPAATVMRSNGRVSSRDRLLAELSEDGVAAEPCLYAPDGLRLISGAPGGIRALAEGRAWVQDEGAQLVAFMFPRPLGRRVADLCAAPGGKTLQLAEWVDPEGIVVATDRHAGRLRRLARAARRAGAGHILAVRADMAATSVPLRGGFDQVLVDAPCSGTGTLRRHPEIRWRLRQEDLKLLAARQDRLLAAAAGLLGPGGVLVYAVCSMEPEEGEEVVARFLASRPDFHTVDPRADLPEPAHEFVDGSHFLRTSPAQGGLDGFFAARLERDGRDRLPDSPSKNP